MPRAAPQWRRDPPRVGLILHMIVGALTTTRPDAAPIVHGAAEVYVVQAPMLALASSSTVTEVHGDARTRELRARGGDLDWDQAIAYSSPKPHKPSRNPLSQTQP